MNKMLTGNVCDYTQIRNIQNRATYVQRLFFLLVHDNFKGFNDNMVILKDDVLISIIEQEIADQSPLTIEIHSDSNDIKIENGNKICLVV